MGWTDQNWSGLYDCRYQDLQHSDQWDYFDQYKEVFALCDFWRLFHKTPQFQGILGSDFEAFGRSIGLDWVFDHAKCPPRFKQYLDLITGMEHGLYLTLVPEGAISFHPDQDEPQPGAGFDDWTSVWNFAKNIMEDIRKVGETPDHRIRRFIRLLKKEAEEQELR